MRQLGIEQAMLSAGAKVDKLYGVNPNNRAVIDIDYGNWRPASFGLGLHRGALFNALWQRCIDAGVRIHAGIAIDRVQDGAQSCSVIIGGDVINRSDLTIVCDGSHSTVRASTNLACKSTPYPWGAYWAVLPAPELGLSKTLLQWYRGASQMLGVMPTGIDPNTGNAVVSMFWSVHHAAHEQFKQEGVDEWKAQVLKLAPSAEPIIGQVTHMDQLQWARYYDVVMPKYHGQRCVVIGDAAHATSPQLGQGTNLALLDAVTLSNCINQASSLQAALAQYTAQRKGHLHFYSQASRLLTPVFQSDWTTIPWLRDRLMVTSSKLPFFKAVNLQTLVGVRKGWLGGQLNID